MQCPYCKEEMQPGYIDSDHIICWIPESERSQADAQMWKSSKTSNSVVLGNYHLFRKATVIAYYCRNCNKVIIDVPEI